MALFICSPCWWLICFRGGGRGQPSLSASPEAPLPERPHPIAVLHNINPGACQLRDLKITELPLQQRERGDGRGLGGVIVSGYGLAAWRACARLQNPSANDIELIRITRPAWVDHEIPAHASCGRHEETI